MPNPHIRTQMTEIRFTAEMVKDKLKVLKPSKASGPDNIHPRILKECADELSVPLSEIFNASMTTGIVPTAWRQAKVTAVFKKGNKNMASNYRPISLTCIPSKIIESLIRDHIIKYMSSQSLFSQKQFGFMKRRSTVLQLIHVMEKWVAALDAKDDIIVAYLDFQKAFDKVPHRRLIYKLNQYKLWSPLITWIQNFLSGRTLQAVVNGESSLVKAITSGIPQGSVLGPTLFAVYVNEIPDIVRSEVYLFADDTKLFHPREPEPTAERHRCTSSLD